MKKRVASLLSGIFRTPQRLNSPAQAVPSKAKSETAPRPSSDSGKDSSIAISVGSHRPLISASGTVIGFEFHINNKLLERLTLRAEPTTQAAYASVLLTSARLVAKTGRIGMARVPAQWLAHFPNPEATPGMMIALEALGDTGFDRPMQAVLTEYLRTMRSGGAKVGWSVGLEFGCNRDFVLVCQGEKPIKKHFQQMASWQPALRSLPVFATDLTHLDDIEAALEHGIAFVCGALTGQTALSSKKDQAPLPPAAQRLGQLLAKLVGGAETQDIVDEIKSDVGLSFRLLQRMQAASFSLKTPTTSLEQAVMLLGRTELYRWLSILMLQFAGNHRAGSALQEVTLWRSRIMELLAAQRKEPNPESLFMLGLASMLGTLLGITPEQVCDTIGCTEHAQQALLHHSGPWQSYLEIIQQLEQNDLQEDTPLVQSFGGIAKVMELSSAAWAWAEANNVRKPA